MTHLLSDLRVMVYCCFFFACFTFFKSYCYYNHGFSLDFSPLTHMKVLYIWREHKLVLCGFSSLIELPNLNSNSSNQSMCS